MPPIPSISHPALSALLLKIPCMAPDLPHFIYFVGQPKLPPQHQH